MTKYNSSVIERSIYRSINLNIQISDVIQTMSDKDIDMIVLAGLDSFLHCVIGRSCEDDIRYKTDSV